VDPAQADLIAQIIDLKKAMAAANSPEAAAAIMSKIEELEKQLAALQPQTQPPINAVQPTAADPAQAELIAQIVKLKGLLSATTSPEDQAAIMAKIQDLEKQLSVLQAQNQPPANTVPPPKPGPASYANPEQPGAVGGVAENKLTIASKQSEQSSPKFKGKLVTISWVGGPGIILQTSESIIRAEWTDVPGTEGKSNIDLLVSAPGNFWRAIKR
jgi:hypothetical protein